MGKKNAFVTTIGFNKNDPAHVQVAEFLNSMERGKAQYIVNAVLAYQNGALSGIPFSSGKGRLTDYEMIRKIVLQVMEEQKNGVYGSKMTAEDAMGTTEQPGASGADEVMKLDAVALGGILQSLEAFKG